MWAAAANSFFEANGRVFSGTVGPAIRWDHTESGERGENLLTRAVEIGRFALISSFWPLIGAFAWCFLRCFRAACN